MIRAWPARPIWNMSAQNIVSAFFGRLGRLPQRWVLASGAALFFAYFTSSSQEFHAARSHDPGKSVLNGDAAGYYIYLPGLFHHGMKMGAQTDSARLMHGSGYVLDSISDRVLTKYTYGTALFHLPFYLAAELMRGSGEKDEWSFAHQRAISFGGIVYWTLGLLLLGLALHDRWSPSIGILLLVLACAAFGTNSFYYAFRQPGYSHTVSFFLSSLALFAIWGRSPGQAPRPRLMLFVAACGGLVAVRPFDVVLVAALTGLLVIDHPGTLRSWRAGLALIGAIIVFIVPQMVYWKYAYGHFIYYSYGDEGFTHWAHPFLSEVLLSPVIGLLPYAPVLFFVPFGLFALWTLSRAIFLVLLTILCAVIYAFASWHAWHFGCGYGMRPFVQYVPLTAIALLALFMWLRSRATPLLHGLVPIVALVCFVNYRSMIEYPVCYRGGVWEWVPYGENMIEAFFGGVDFNMTRR